MARVRPRVDRAARDRLAQLAGVDAVDGAVRRDRVPGLGRHAVRAVLRRLLPAAGRQPAVAARGRRARRAAGLRRHRSCSSPRRSRWSPPIAPASGAGGGRPCDGGCWSRSPSAPCSWPTSSPSTPRSTSPPTTTRTASIYWLLTGLHGPTSPPAWRRWPCCSSASVAQPTASRRRHLGRRRVAVLAPRRRHLVVRLLDDLDHPVRLLLAVALPSAAAAVAGVVSLARRPATGGGRRRDRSARRLGAELYATQCASVPRHRRQRASRTAARRSDDEGRRPSTSCCAPAACRWPHRTCRPSRARCGTPRSRSWPSSTTPARSATGPTIPDVDIARGDVAAGGELYRLNCAACHVASGSGAAIGGGREAPT